MRNIIQQMSCTICEKLFEESNNAKPYDKISIVKRSSGSYAEICDSFYRSNFTYKDGSANGTGAVASPENTSYIPPYSNASVD